MSNSCGTQNTVHFNLHKRRKERSAHASQVDPLALIPTAASLDNFLITPMGADKNLLVSATQIVAGVPESACTPPISPTRAMG